MDRACSTTGSRRFTGLPGRPSGKHIADTGYAPDCDLNRDGVINFSDIGPWSADFGKSPVDGISDPDGAANPVGYAGYLFIDDFGPHWYARHRFYDPIAGRWLTRDPAGYVDGMSLYLYGRSTPLTLVDPLGLQPTNPNSPGFRQYWDGYAYGSHVAAGGVVSGSNGQGGY